MMLIIDLSSDIRYKSVGAVEYVLQRVKELTSESKEGKCFWLIQNWWIRGERK